MKNIGRQGYSDILGIKNASIGLLEEPKWFGDYARSIGVAASLTATLFGAACGGKAPEPPKTGIASVQYVSQHPFGEIPYGRNLRVNRYNLNLLKDIHTLDVKDPIATLDTTFSRAYPDATADRSSDSINYIITIVGESEDDVNRVANNLSRYNIVMIVPPFDDGRGLRTDAVRVIPSENGHIYQVPASSLRFSRLETYPLKGDRQNTFEGTIEPDGVHRPWLPQNQRIEKPCVSEATYTSPCAVTSKPTPAPKPPVKK